MLIRFKKLNKVGKLKNWMNIRLFHCAMYTFNTENTRNLDSNAWDSLSSLNCLATVEYLFFSVYPSFVQYF